MNREMGFETTVGESAPPSPRAKPTILVPARGSMESLFRNGLGGLGFSPGPITLVSSFFSEQGSLPFSQLLAGAMLSPLGKEEVGGNDFSNDKNSGEIGGGYKNSRPKNLVVSQPQPPESLSSLFMISPGLTPSGLLSSPGFLSQVQSPFGMTHQQALAHVTAQAAISQSYIEMQAELQRSFSSPPAEALAICPLADSDETLMQQKNVTDMESAKIESSEVSQCHKRVAGDNQAGDGYNWRKYGQKNVKGSECPRSYYKCSHLHCSVKKKVERTLEGSVSEIIYRGQHNHDPPQASKRGRDETTNNTQEFSGHHSIHSHNNDIIVVDDEDDVVPDAKRRSLDVGQQPMPILSHQTMMEPKIVVQTRSEVDLLDDGYKWRKYGQKVVKGNSHPRSYYKCTYTGCAVRKHVERASSDPKAVITSYEGKHNHEIPTGKCSSYANQIQKIASEHPSTSRQVNLDQIPITLHLKIEEEIAA